MLHALTKQIAGVVGDVFGVDEVFVVMNDAEEVMNISKRVLEVTPKTGADLGRIELKVFNKPMCFLRLNGVSYDDNRSGYRRARTGYTWVDSLGKYVALKTVTMNVKYEIRAYTVYGMQGLDLTGWEVFMPRSTSINAVLNLQIGIEVPVSLLLSEVYESVVDFVLEDKGMKLYRNGGLLESLVFVVPVNVAGGRGEAGVYKEIWGDISSILFEPIRKIDVKWGVEGESVLENMPCKLEVP